MTRRTVFRLFGLALLLVAGLIYLTRPERIGLNAIPTHTADLANGERMFWTGGCASCHAAPGAKGNDKLVLAGGVELDTPFGLFRAPNLSPDPEHGIGGWSEADFVTAMTLGTSPQGTHYYPAFPYTSYRNMRLEDLIDLKAFLDTLPASTNVVADHDLAFPFSWRGTLGFWKALYLKRVPPPAPQDADETVLRGHYLLTGPGHCAVCHTPRDLLGGQDLDRWLAGGPNPDGEGMIPNITPSRSGIGSWSAGDIAYYLESGFTPDFDSVGGSMADVQENWSRVPAADREAIAAYLKTVTPMPAQDQQD
uniref:c-type cytochrome n=1 Tax=Stappia sp. TaxID=1870903 RepID=UPI003BA943F2